MIFDKLTQAPCIIVEPPGPDTRCNDSDFALAHPGLCSGPALILKPGAASLCVSDSLQFRAFSYADGVETELTSGVRFTSSSVGTFTIGINGGAGTAFAAGAVNITATYGDLTATALLTVLPGLDCCAAIRVLTAIVIDDSLSMGRDFGGAYATRLIFAKALATAYAQTRLDKDAIRVWSINSVITAHLTAFSESDSAILAAIAEISQTAQKTNLLAAFTTAATDLLANTSGKRILLLLSEGEQTVTTTDQQAILDAASLFKGAGGVVIVVGPRASGTLGGFDLLERLATTGYFINAMPTTATEAFDDLNFLKSLLCAGNCIPAGDTYVNTPALNFSSFLNWEVLSGRANLLGPGLLDLQPGHGLYAELAYPGSAVASILKTIDAFDLVAGNSYTIAFDIAGNQVANVVTAPPKVYLREVGANDSDPNIFEATMGVAWDAGFQRFSFSFTAGSNRTVKLHFEHQPNGANSGVLLDNIEFRNSTTLEMLLTDNFDSENLQYIPPRCGASAAVPAIADAGFPTMSRVNWPDGQMAAIATSYCYAITWVTNDGETAVPFDLCFATQVGPNPDSSAIRVDLPVPPASVTAVRLWRNAVDGGTDLFLLAVLLPAELTYFDAETHVEFFARHDPDLSPPTVNTTGKAAGTLGGGVAECCYESFYYETGDSVLTPLIPEMTTDNAPSGVASASSVLTDGIGTHSAYLAFEASDSYWAAEPGVPAWLAYEFAVPTVANFYGFKPMATSTGSTWTIEGSQDGSAWTVLDTQTLQDTDYYWIERQLYPVDLQNTTAYLHYRIHFTNVGAISFANIALFQLYSSTDQGDVVTTFTDNCPDCSPEMPGAQVADSAALADIESGSNPPLVFTAVVTDLPVSCPSGTVNLTAAGTEWDLVTSEGGTLGFPFVFVVHLTGSAIVIGHYVFAGLPGWSPRAWTFEGSNDGAAWTLMDEKISQASYDSSVKTVLVENNSVAYSWYRLTVTAYSGGVADLLQPPYTGNNFIYAKAATTALGSATRTGPSQPEAQALAIAAATSAALATLNCAPVFTDTVNHTAVCPVGTLGTSVQKTVTRRSLKSVLDAHDQALAVAMAEANAELVCTGSNNTQMIEILDGATPPTRSNPYPSIKHVTGVTGLITKVTCVVKKIDHGAPDDIRIMLKSPSGTCVELMSEAGGSNILTINASITFDDDAADFVPTPIIEGTYKPTLLGAALQYPTPAPTIPYGVALSDFIGETANGSWSLWICDDTGLDFGHAVLGWDLTITTA